MKKVNFLLLLGVTVCSLEAIAQCGTIKPLGQSFSMMTKVLNSAKCVSADATLNTAVFVYRHNPAVYGGNSGNLRYDVSMNGGTTWTLAQGVLNPFSTSFVRYPNGFLANPAGNTNPLSAFVTYMAPTVGASFFFDGMVCGARKLDGTGNTELYNPQGSQTLVPVTSMVKGAPNTFWAVGQRLNNIYKENNVDLLKGTLGAGGVSWTTHTVLAVPATSIASNAAITSVNIAFDPTGTFGWVSMIANISGVPQDHFYPVFYSSDDGGNTWSGPHPVDPTLYACVTASLQNATISADGITDLTVDINGNPHLFVPMVSTHAGIPDLSKWHHLFDVTREHGLWTMHPVAALNSDWLDLVSAAQLWSPQVSRSRDGKKVFFSWTESPNVAPGAPNNAPDLLARGLDVISKNWTMEKNFTSCNPAASGKVFFNHTASEVLEPAASVYKLVPVYGKFQSSAMDPDAPSDFIFLDDCTFSDGEFSIPQNNPVLTTNPGLEAGICIPGSVTLEVTGAAGSVLWFNGITTPSIQIQSTGNYSVAARVGCDVGVREFTVSLLSLELQTSRSEICAGESIVLVANSNGHNLTWQPGGATSSMVTVSPELTTTYTVVAHAGAGCTETSELLVNVDQCTNVSEFKTPDMDAYPLPVSDILHLNVAGAALLEVVDLTGRVVLTVHSNVDLPLRIDMSEKPAGIYLLSGIVNDKPIRVKFVKQ